MVIENLKDYCGCVKEATDEDVVELVNLVSMATGWMRSPCESFQLSDRREVIDLPSCMDCAYEFEPYYHPFVEDSFKFSLLTTKGTEQTKTEITDFAYFDTDKKIHINVGLPKCSCVQCSCGCPPKYQLYVEYQAGYDEIPDCLLPVFCDMLEVVHAKRDCDCSCSCDGETMMYDKYGNLITQLVRYKSGDAVSAFLQNDLGKMFVSLYKDQLGFMSLIRRPTFTGMLV